MIIKFFFKILLILSIPIISFSGSISDVGEQSNILIPSTNPFSRLKSNELSQILVGSEGDKIEPSNIEMYNCRKRINLNKVQEIIVGLKDEEKRINRLISSINNKSNQWLKRDLENQLNSVESLKIQLETFYKSLTKIPVSLITDMPKFYNLDQIKSYIENQSKFKKAILIGNSLEQAFSDIITQIYDPRIISKTINLSRTNNLSRRISFDNLLEHNFYSKVYWGDDVQSNVKVDKIRYFLKSNSNLNFLQTKKCRDCKSNSIMNSHPAKSPCIADHPVLAMFAIESKKLLSEDHGLTQMLLDHLNQCEGLSAQALFITDLVKKSLQNETDSGLCSQIVSHVQSVSEKIQATMSDAYENQFSECRNSGQYSSNKKNKQNLNTNQSPSKPILKSVSEQLYHFEREFFIPPIAINGCESLNEVKKLRLNSAIKLIRLREIQENKIQEMLLNDYQLSIKRNLSVDAGFNKNLFQPNAMRVPMEERFANTPALQGQRTNACVAYALSSSMGEKKNENSLAVSLDPMALDRQLRDHGFEDKLGGGVLIDDQFLSDLALFQAPSLKDKEKTRTIDSYSADMGLNSYYSLLDLKYLAISTGFVGIIDTDARTEIGNQMTYTYHDAHTGHVLHVIDYSENKMDLQIGKKVPMFQVRDSLAKTSMTYWVNANDLAVHLLGLIVIHSTK